MFKKMLLFVCSAFFIGTVWAAPNPVNFIEQIANKALKDVQASAQARSGDMVAINRIVEKDVLPYVDMNKTTRLSVGRPWREADRQQRDALIAGFTKKLVLTYSGAFKFVDSHTTIKLLPFRGNLNGKDIIIGSIMKNSTQRVRVDYRLENLGNEWRVYDLAIEGVWLIQNYRNQFSEMIRKRGIDGLIKALQAN